MAQGVFNLNSWLNMQAADILSVFTGFPGYKAFFPFKYDLKILYLFPFIPFIYLSILLANFGKARDTVDKRFSVSFLIVGLIFIVLLKKRFPPFGNLTVMFFNLPLLPVLRSYEKIAIFMPFTIFTAIYGLICPQRLKDKKMLLGIPLVFLGVLPFFIGGLQKKYTIAHTQANDYLTSDYSSLVKIPSDYYEQAAFSNTMPADTKIQASPYCALGSDSWAYYPKWGLRGFNPAEILFEKPTIAQSMSSYNLYGWNPNLTFNELNLPPLWYPKLLSFFNVSHILYHKDVAPEFIVKSYPKYDYLEKTGRLSKERETENLIFYSLDKDKYESPHLYVTHNKIEIYDSYESLPYVLSLEDFPTKSYFEVNSNGPDSKDSEIYSVLTRNPSVLDLQNLNWDFNWAWDVPLHDISLIEHKLLRKQEARVESSAVDWQEKIDVKLSNLVKRAFDVSEHNKLDNVSLSEDFVSEFTEIKEIISMNLEHHKAPYYAEKIFKYLLMIRNKLGTEQTYEFYSGFIDDFYTFLESTDLLECSGLCYSAFVPRAGDYEILVVGEDLDGISLFRKDSFGERELEEVSSGMEGSAYFGKSSFGENSQVSLRLKFDGTKNLISGALWAKYSGSLKDRFDVATSDSGYDIFYKEIAMWDSSSNYSLSFDYNAGDLDFYFFIVESPTTIGKDTSFDMEQFLENPEIYEYTEVPS
ncbi:hypothetical protein HQ584_07030, partial [Patescibacteria group bacterium]|nr:hypothetical protein [Patescibacteria group bacterium]